MSNGKVALATVPVKEKKVHIHHTRKEEKDISPRIDMITEAAFRFVMVFFGLFVAVCAFWSGGWGAFAERFLEFSRLNISKKRKVKVAK